MSQLERTPHGSSVAAGDLLLESIDWTQIRQVFDSIPVRIALLDRDNRYLYVNSEWCKSFDTAEDPVMGRTTAELFGEEVFAIIRPLVEGALAGESLEWDGWVELRGGRRFVRRAFAPLRDVAGVVRGYISFTRDLTELRQIEQAKDEAETALAQLKRAQENLVRAEKLASLGQIVAGVAHEINTPVGNALAASSQIYDETARLETLITAGKLRRSELEDHLRAVKELSDILMRNCRRAGQLIRDFKQVAADQMSGQRRRFDLADQLRENLRTLQHRFDRAKVSLVIELPANILMDSLPGGLSQIIINLAENALAHAFAPGAAGSLTVSAKPIAPDRVEITIADDGRGITRNILPKIFDPFFTTNRGAGNTGLGLHIVHNLVTGPLGGTIRVTSAVGKGTQFVLRLPLVSPAPDTFVSNGADQGSGRSGANRSWGPSHPATGDPWGLGTRRRRRGHRTGGVPSGSSALLHQGGREEPGVLGRIGDTGFLQVRELKRASHGSSLAMGRLLLESIDWRQVRQVFDSIPVRMGLHDRGHRHLYVNTAWSRFHGKREDVVVGSTIAQVFNEEIFAQIRPWAERTLAGEVGLEWLGWIEFPSGRRFVGRTYVPLCDSTGAIQGYFIFSRDLTDQRQTEQAKDEAERALAQLKQAQEGLVRAEKLAALGQLVAGVAHEINTPVGNALAASSQIRDETVRLVPLFAAGKLRRSELEHYLGVVNELSDILMRNCQRAAQLIRDFSQVTADQMSGQRRPFDLANQLRETLRTLQHRFHRAKVSLVTDLPVNIVMDSVPGALSQIIINLAENALAHAFAPGTAGSLTVSAQQIAQDRVEITVADDGKGISQEVLPKIFDPFFTTNRDAGNTGIGLHIVHNLVTGPLGGTIHVTSAIGAGTRFVLRLSLASPAPAATVSHDEIAPLLGTLSR